MAAPNNTSTHGDRIRNLFTGSISSATVVAPYIKINALRSLLDVLCPDTHLSCVTRWLPREVAAGVSDPEIFNLLEKRGNYRLTLVDRLHAKLYIADQRCLAGSANVTLAALGDQADNSNIEVLVETTINDPGIATTLREIAQAERPATKGIAETARLLADNLSSSRRSAISLEAPWFPASRRPEHAYRFYVQPPIGYVRASDRVLLADLASSNLQPGLDQDQFRTAIRSLLAAVPIAQRMLESTEDTTVTRADAHAFLEISAAGKFSSNELWLAFVNWMAYFFPERVMKQEIAEIALRGARLLNP